MLEKLEVQEIKLAPKLEPHLSFYTCNFCGKQVNTQKSEYLAKLSGESFYCGHCLRHGFNAKTRRNVLITSFRPLFGYYYYELYLKPPRKLWLSDLQDLQDLHRRVGLKMPVFSYDPQTMYWFIDYNKIGKGKKKISHNEVRKTVLDILACFDLPIYVPSIKTAKFANRYLEAMDQFYKFRHRPENKRILLPTLQNCGDFEKSINLELTKNFTFQKISG